MKWWFSRGPLSLLTVPVFLILAALMISSYIQGAIQMYAYALATTAVWGWIGGVLMLFIWPFVVFLPGECWRAAINTPPQQLDPKYRGQKSIIVTMVLLIGFSIALQWVHGRAIGWIADRDPDAAFKAGVSGSMPPSWMREIRAESHD